MNKLKIYGAATLVGIGAILISASIIHAKSILPPAQEAAAQACDKKLVNGYSTCDHYYGGGKNDGAYEQCNNANMVSYGRCLKRAGIGDATSHPMPTRPPRLANPPPTSVTQLSKTGATPTPKPKASPTPSPHNRQKH